MTTDRAPGTWRAWPPRDRRYHQRTKAWGRAELRTLDDVFVGRCVDVSLGGFGFQSDLDLPLGLEVEIRIELPRGRMLHSRGEVVRRVGDTLGIRFMCLGPRTFDAILAQLSEPAAY